MIKKHHLVLTISIALILLFIATLVYPGGSLFDKHSVGFDWTQNFITNLLGEKAINGSNNPSRPWAVSGIFFLALSFGIFYYQFSTKIPAGKGKYVIRYAGIGSAVFAFLTVTPFHDSMVTLAIVLSMISVFYITALTFQSRLHFQKIASCICLLFLYLTAYFYYSGALWTLLPIMQKVQLFVTVVWMFSLHFFSTSDDFTKSGQNARIETKH